MFIKYKINISLIQYILGDDDMKIIKMIGILGTIAMSIALFNGFFNGSFFDDGGELFNNPWGIVSLVDLYVGFVIFSIWIVYREKTLIRQIVWVIFMMIFGFLTSSIYLLYALYQSKNDVLKFIHGKHADKYTIKSDAHETQ